MSTYKNLTEMSRQEIEAHLGHPIAEYPSHQMTNDLITLNARKCVKGKIVYTAEGKHLIALARKAHR